MEKIRLCVWLILVIILLLLIFIGRIEPEYPVSEWIKTDKKEYVLGEEVIIYFINQGNVTLERGDWGIVKLGATTYKSAPRIPLAVPLRPGESFVRIWDQTLFSGSKEQAAPGVYIVWWMPGEWNSYKPIGMLRQYFKITRR